MHEILEKARPAFHDGVSYRIDTFHHFINIFDFDEKFNQFLHEVGI